MFTACCLLTRVLCRIVEVAQLHFPYFSIEMGSAYCVESIDMQFNCRNDNESIPNHRCIQFTSRMIDSIEYAILIQLIEIGVQ